MQSTLRIFCVIFKYVQLLFFPCIWKLWLRKITKTTTIYVINFFLISYCVLSVNLFEQWHINMTWLHCIHHIGLNGNFWATYRHFFISKHYFGFWPVLTYFTLTVGEWKEIITIHWPCCTLSTCMRDHFIHFYDVTCVMSTSLSHSLLIWSTVNVCHNHKMC